MIIYSGLFAFGGGYDLFYFSLFILVIAFYYFTIFVPFILLWIPEILQMFFVVDCGEPVLIPWYTNRINK